MFPEAPLVAYKRPKHIKEYLIRAKLPPTNFERPRRFMKGTKKCNKCLICPLIQEGREIKANKFTWKTNANVSCETYDIVYVLICTKEKCKQKEKNQQLYIGETERTLEERICEHIGYINTKNMSQPAGQHFNQAGHSKAGMKVAILEKIFKQDQEYRKERESHLIRHFYTFYCGKQEALVGTLRL